MLACITVLPATLLMGGVFPLTVRVAAGGLDSVGHDVGNAYALNTVGAIVGSFLSGFVVLPRARARSRASTSRCCSTWRWRRCCSAVAPELPRRRRQAGVAAAVALALLGLVIPRWDLGSFSSGFFRVSIAREYIYRKIHKRGWQTPELVFYEDGMATTVSVDQLGQDLLAQEQRQGRRLERRRHADADHRRPAAVAVLQPAARRPRWRWSATARASPPARSRSTRSRRWRWSSWSRPSTAASRFFDNDNHRPLQNPKVTARVGDGRNFLTQRSDKFDVIVSEPSNPWLTGVSNLFTREYFKLRQDAPRRRTASSASGRSSTRWRPGTSRPSYGTVREEFPYVYVFAAEDCRRTPS